MKIQTLKQAEEYLYQFIPQNLVYQFPGELGLQRTKKLAELLDNPQEKINIIHIAGTSGKGSTAQFTENLLRAHGFETGLHISPHLIDIRERFQINGKLISTRKYLKYLGKLASAIRKMGRTKHKKPTYFEIITVLAYYIFCKENVDYAVVETGLGGWYDATNIVASKNKLCILTRIGIDHTAILGSTLSQISYQKVHIVQRGNTVVTIRQKPAAQRVIEAFVLSQNATLLTVKKDKKLKLKVEGDFQKENCSLALASLNYLSKRDGFAVDQAKIKEILSQVVVRGRFEIFKKQHQKIIIDGAHNPQKMSAFISSLKQKFPGWKFTFLIAFKRGKDVSRILDYIIPLARRIVISSFFNTDQGIINFSLQPQDVAHVLKRKGYEKYEIIPDKKKALSDALKKPGDIVITGSLYFIGELYPFFHT